MNDSELRSAGIALTYSVRVLASGKRAWEITVSAPPGSDTAARSALESAATYLDTLCDVEAPEPALEAARKTSADPALAAARMLDPRAVIFQRLTKGPATHDQLVSRLPKGIGARVLDDMLQDKAVRVLDDGRYMLV